MPSLVEEIEVYLRRLLVKAGEGSVELQRNQLADFFACAPSQINYVLQTRFSLERGFLVESRRGGGGYIRITKLDVPEHQDLIWVIHQELPERVRQSLAEDLIQRLAEEDVITNRESSLMRSVIHQSTLGLDLPVRDQVRAKLLKAMLIALLRS